MVCGVGLDVLGTGFVLAAVAAPPAAPEFEAAVGAAVAATAESVQGVMAQSLFVCPGIGQHHLSFAGGRMFKTRTYRINTL